MKKYILVFALVFIPFLTKASFDSNIQYGTKNSDNVKEIQEFLTEQSVYSGPITGNFYSLTLAGVKNFQRREGIKADGYWGPATRSKANELLNEQIGGAEQAAFETGENLPLSNNDAAFKFADGISYNFNGKLLSSPAPVPVATGWDFCNNILGEQRELPPGMVRSADNNCWTAPVAPVVTTPVVQPSQPTSTPIINNPIKSTSTPVTVSSLSCSLRSSQGGELTCYNSYDFPVSIKSLNISALFVNNYDHGSANFLNLKDTQGNTLLSKNTTIEEFYYQLPFPALVNPGESKVILILDSNTRYTSVNILTYSVNNETKNILGVWGY